MNLAKKLAVIIGLIIVPTLVYAVASTHFSGLVTICDVDGSCPTGTTATAAGELLVEGDLEVDGNMVVAGTLTASGGTTNGATLTFDNGGTLDNVTNGSMDISEASEDLRFTFTANTCTITSTTSALVTFAGAVTFADAVTLSDGALIDQSANNVVGITENGEDITLTYAANLVTIDSTTSATIAITPATAIAGVLTESAGAGALTFTNSAASVLTIDADASALDIGSAGLTTALRYSSVDSGEVFTFNAGLANAPQAMGGGHVTLTAKSCGKTMTIAATDDTFTWTLPATIAGCKMTFLYTGADAGALVDISPVAADGIYGTLHGATVVSTGANAICSTTCAGNGCSFGLNTGGVLVACSDATADSCLCNLTLSGTDDADVGITKATIRRGDSITILGDGVDGWYTIDARGSVANN